MKAAFCLLPLALLAACDSSPTIEAKNASVADVAEKVRDAGGAATNICAPASGCRRQRSRN